MIATELACTTIVRHKTSERIELFGCPEDWTCKRITKARAEGRQRGADQTDADWHNELCGFPPRSIAERGIIRMCEDCKIPTCRSCEMKFVQARGKSNVPMALANDNWYGYVHPTLARDGTGAGSRNNRVALACHMCCVR